MRFKAIWGYIMVAAMIGCEGAENMGPNFKITSAAPSTLAVPGKIKFVVVYDAAEAADITVVNRAKGICDVDATKVRVAAGKGKSTNITIKITPRTFPALCELTFNLDNAEPWEWKHDFTAP